jgi:hypothetical protein
MHFIFFLNTTLHWDPNKVGIISIGSTKCEIRNLQYIIQIYEINKEKYKSITLSSYWADSTTRGPRSRAKCTHQRGPKHRRGLLTRMAHGWLPPARAAADTTGPLARGRKDRGGTATAGARRRRVGWWSWDHHCALRMIPNWVRYYGDPRGGWGARYRPRRTVELQWWRIGERS